MDGEMAAMTKLRAYAQREALAGQIFGALLPWLERGDYPCSYLCSVCLQVHQGGQVWERWAKGTGGAVLVGLVCREGLRRVG